MNIQRLDKLVIGQIAAGEVIENPAAVLKELIENALDANANQIDVLLKDNGFAMIQVRDNGSGIEKEDLPLAVESFATSKLKNFDDLNHMSSLGFRGEALGSIRSVAKLTVESKAQNADIAYAISAEQDIVSPVKPCALSQGTRMVVENLFAGLPARKKFQKKEASAKKDLLDVFFTYAIGFFSCDFHYSDEKKTIQLPAKKNMLERICDIYPQYKAEHFFTVFSENETAQNSETVEGYVSDFSIQKNNKEHIFFFVNGRPVQYSPLTKTLNHLYGEMLPRGKFPLAVLHYQTSPQSIDVNVHPGKKEIRFAQESQVRNFLYKAIRHALTGEKPIDRKNLNATRATKQKRENYFFPNQTNTDVMSVMENPQLPFGQTSVTENTPEHFLSQDFLTPLQENQKSQKSQETKKEKFSHKNCKYYGRLFNTFALFACEDSLLLMDQHTAFERIGYENFLRKISQQQELTQPLVAPLNVQASEGEKNLLQEYLPALEKMGFRLQDMGPAGFSLTAIPYYIVTSQETEALYKALELLQKNDNISPTDLFEELAASLACRAALKKGDEISGYDLNETLQELLRCQEPFRCPHGRPTLVQLSRDEVFLWFNRTGSRAR